MMGRKQKLCGGDEYDLLYGRRYYHWHKGIKKWIKRKMNKRFRKEKWHETKV